ncbi:hypothetical protein RhiirC2_779627 [Rhizophagus irregularis]|uniref:Uncharacterized protein n=1 Tax=Rhizophagus irregularis TaxID=588596 RepID=A0A2N1N9H6_9GLOM|nr:hypothetical protein RhiirC2_779627 [Rhizophagus irregularis]
MTDNAMGFHIDYFHKNSRKNSHFLGDCDYFRNIQGALQRKWNVEIWAWHLDDKFKDLTIIINFFRGVIVWLTPKE